MKFHLQFSFTISKSWVRINDMHMKKIIITSLSILLLAATGCHKDRKEIVDPVADGALAAVIPEFYHTPDSVVCNAILFPDDARSLVDNQEHTITVDGDTVHIGYSGTLKAGMTVAYPKTMFSSAKDGKVHVKFPEVQEYRVADDGRQILDFPRYGVVASDKTISLHSSCSIQKFNIKNSQLVDISVDEVAFSMSFEHEGCLWGEGDLDATQSDAINPANLTGGSRTMKMHLSNFVIPSGETRTLYVCVPDPKVGLYFTITFTEQDLEECTLIYNAPGVTFGAYDLVLEAVEIDTHNGNVLRIRPSETGKLSGDGSEKNPYLIYTADDLYNLSSSLSDMTNELYIVQMNDIDFSSKSVSGNSLLGEVYTLHYYGQGHKLSGTKVPLVGFAGKGSFITDLCFETDARPLARRLQGTWLKNLRVIGSRTNLDGETVIGGIVDTLSLSKMEHCTSTVDIKLQEAESGGNKNVVVGGLAGWAYGTYPGEDDCHIYDCHYEGDLDATATNAIANCKVGGLIGCFDNGNLRLTSSQVHSDISSYGKDHSGYTLNVGGLVGYIDCDKLIVEGCETYGSVDATVSSTINLGGMIGYYRARTTDFWECDVYNTVNSTVSSDQTNIGGFIGYACGAKDLLTFTHCHSESDNIRGKGDQEVYAGGYIGTLIDNPDYIIVQISHCWNKSAVEASSIDDNDYWKVAGGFIGYCKFSNDSYKGAVSLIVNSENRGVVTCDGPNQNRYKGGFIGWVYEEATCVINCVSRPRIKDDGVGDRGYIGSITGSGGHVMYGAGNKHGRNGSTHPALGYGGITDGTYYDEYDANSDDAPIPDEALASLNNWIDKIHCVEFGWYTYNYTDGGYWQADGLH